RFANGEGGKGIRWARQPASTCPARVRQIRRDVNLADRSLNRDRRGNFGYLGNWLSRVDRSYPRTRERDRDRGALCHWRHFFGNGDPECTGLTLGGARRVADDDF